MASRNWAIALVVAGLVATGPAHAAADDPILIGIEGKALSVSSDQENLGMRLVIKAVNDQGGVNGRKLVERSYDRTKTGGPAIAETVANAKRLGDEDKVLLIYNHGGPASIQIAAYAMEQKVPYLFPHTALVTMDGGRYVFTSFPRFAGETAVMYRYLSHDRGMKRIAILYDENEYGRFFRDRLQALAAENGYVVTGTQGITEREPANLDAQMTELRKGSPDAVILGLYPVQAQRAMAAKAKLDWREVRMVSTGPLSDEQYLNVPGGYAEGTLGFCYYPDPNVSEEPGVLEYRRLMARYYPGEELNRYSLYGFAFGRLIVEGLKRAGAEPTRESFIDAMEAIRDFDEGGIMPAVSLSKTNHHAQKAGFICELKDRKFVALSGWFEP